MRDDDKIFPYLDLKPTIHSTAFLAPGAKIVGDVQIGAEASVWFNTVVRGDVNYVKIGARTNVQDCSMLHVTRETHPLVIGEGCTIGHSVKLHGCVLEDECLIGIGAIVLDGAVVEKHATVAAGAVVTPGARIPSGTIAAGVPAKPLRDLTPEEMGDLPASAERYVKFAKLTAESIREAE
jgi:carbonic anhydrase/acetyltransferase-like protein (isoleucine patch superfamily)